MDLPLGFLGIIKLTTHVILRNSKHFLCIALIFVLSYASAAALIPSPGSAAQLLAHTASQLYSYIVSHKDIPPPPDTPTQPPSYPLLIAAIIISIFLRLVAQPMLTFSVCRAVLHKSLACKISLLAVPRSALNLILTLLCIFGVMLGYFVGTMVLMMIMVVGLSIIRINPVLVVVICSVVMMGGAIYLMIVWSLADTVAILEEKRGWEAITRSRYLVDGSKWVVFGLLAVFGVCMMFMPISGSDESSAIWRWSCAVLSVGLEATIGLWSMACMVVLYLSCKSRLKEPLDTIVALSAEFGPPETSAKYMDLEAAQRVTA